MDSDKKKIVNEIKKDIIEWNRREFDISPIVNALKQKDAKKFVELYKKFKKLIPEMERLRELFEDYSGPEAESIRIALRNPLVFETMRDKIETLARKRREAVSREEEIFDMLTGVKEITVESGINENMRFDNFVVYDGNELAYRAAKKIIEEPGSINPLIFVGESGTGKTHLLNAIGNEFSKRGRVQYVNAEEVLIGKRVDFDVNMLLLDDAHVLFENEDMHNMLNLILDNFTREGKQLVLASNFNVSHYTMEPSLKNKLEAGVTIEIALPDENSRIKILKIKKEEMQADINDEIIEYLAKNVKNTGKLIAIVKKIMAFSRILGEKPNISLAAEMLHSRMPLKPGFSYLVEEEKPYRSINYIKEAAYRGYDIVCITRMNPEKFKNFFGIKGEVYWLTDHTTDLPTVSPILENLNYILEEYANKKAVIFLDGVDYLISKNSGEAVVQFLRHMVDVISESNAILVVSLNPKTIDEKYAKILEREMEII